MNRQERRRLARQAERQRKFNQQYGPAIQERQNLVDEQTVRFILISVGLAMNKLYGWKANGCGKVMMETYEQMRRVMNEEITVQDLCNELNKVADLELVWKD